MSEVDKWDAPAGCIAVAAPYEVDCPCDACALENGTCGGIRGGAHSCLASVRPDGQSVIFVKHDEQPVIVVALCEAANVFLRPNRLYRFVQQGDCAKCAELAAKYDGEGNYIQGGHHD